MHVDHLRVDHQYSRDRDSKNIDRQEFIAYLELLYFSLLPLALVSMIKVPGLKCEKLTNWQRYVIFSSFRQ